MLIVLAPFAPSILQQPRSPRTPLRRGGSNSSLADREGFRARLASITYSLSEVDLLDDDGTEINDSDVFGGMAHHFLFPFSESFYVELTRVIVKKNVP